MKKLIAATVLSLLPAVAAAGQKPPTTHVELPTSIIERVSIMLEQKLETQARQYLERDRSTRERHARRVLGLEQPEEKLGQVVRPSR
ncbi:MAG: hypothetical protein DRI34_02050 [Deltaproteobacteria bacterium]|nr:MAG: hypothetical protein DRI34_02050 [Deltaproteobacteria bacterium]